MAGSLSVLGIAAGLIGLVTLAPELAGPPEQVPEPASGYVIPRAPDGQFYVEGKADGAAVRFMVDPGADRVLIAGVDAARLGLKAGPGFSEVVLPRLSVGPHQLTQVAAVIAPDLPVSLLGRSFLSRLAGAGIEDGKMVLR